MVDGIVQDDDPLAPAGRHVGLQGAPEQREVPGKDDEHRKVALWEGHGGANGPSHDLWQVCQEHLWLVPVLKLCGHPLHLPGLAQF